MRNLYIFASIIQEMVLTYPGRLYKRKPKHGWVEQGLVITVTESNNFFLTKNYYYEKGN